MIEPLPPAANSGQTDAIGVSQVNSPAYLAHAFRRRYGVPPLQYRQDLRLSAAARLLQCSSLSCKEIAARLGFADVQTFTRHHGTSPGRMQRTFSHGK